jgi:short subunit dehydrogenase-like uncharacterized protein
MESTLSASSPAQTIRPRDRSRTYDIVLLGATGFTGRYVARELAERYLGSDLRWAIAGRNLEKLERVRAELAEIDASYASLDLVVADSKDRESLDALAASTSVVCTTVGPYAKYGSELVAACVAAGTDYCDLTGEVHWARDMIDAHQEAAAASGARIVHFCGFDSIPSDLGTLMVQQAAQERHGEACGEVRYVMWRASGGFSGGTVDSMVNTIERVRARPELRKVLANPFALAPAGARSGPRQPNKMAPHYSEEARGWMGPFVMAPVNTRVVHRSNALLGHAYGEDFVYSEVMRTGSGARGAAMAYGIALGLGALVGSLNSDTLRPLVQKYVLPKPGEGPSPEAVENGFFEARIFGDVGGEVIEGKVRGERDPGYGATATMLSEAAVCLALDGDDLESPGGVLTPATAMGAALIERLRAAGMTFEVR